MKQTHVVDFSAAKANSTGIQSTITSKQPTNVEPINVTGL